MVLVFSKGAGILRHSYFEAFAASAAGRVSQTGRAVHLTESQGTGEPQNALENRQLDHCHEAVRGAPLIYRGGTRLGAK
jgi:hypothetical protein